MLTHNLFPKSKRAVVAFSGGEDSVLLWHVLEAISKRRPDLLCDLQAVHIDHQLRSNSTAQANALKKNYSFLNIETLKETAPTQNIELWARQQRHQQLRSYLREGDVLYMGHHIDDSIEWYLRQVFGGTRDPKRVGIPVLSGVIRRPFHCLSKKQISQFVKRFNLFHIHDQSNDDFTFQRNFIRHKVLNPIYQAFPKGAAHFVEMANALVGNNDKEPCQMGQNFSIIHCEEESSWESKKDFIKSEIMRLSFDKRGELRKPLNALVRSLQTGDGAKGPYSFSGGVKVYCYAQMLILVNPLGLAEFRQWDREMTLGNTQIPMRFLKTRTFRYKNFENVLPFIFYKPEDFKFMGSKAMKGLGEDELFPLFFEMMKKQGYSVRPLSFLSKSLKKGKKKTKKCSLAGIFIKFDPAF